MNLNENIKMKDFYEQAQAIVHRIDALLVNQAWSLRPTGPGIVGGLSGLSLYLNLALQSGDSLLDADLIRERLECSLNESIDNIGEAHGSPWLHYGLSGLGWTLDRIIDSGTLPIGGEDLNEAIDDFLLSYLRACEKKNIYVAHELMTGLAGACLYGLGRPSGTMGNAIVEACLDRLEATAIHTRDGCAWVCPGEKIPSNAMESFKREDFNLGVAHGIPSVVAVLGMASAKGFSRATSLYDESLSWLRKAAGHHPNGSQFEHSIPSDPNRVQEAVGSRVAWCYGDLGISAVLMKASLASKNAELTSFAADLGLGCCRRARANEFVNDAGLCHGSAGNMLIYKNLYLATRQAELKMAAEGCLIDTVTNHWSEENFFQSFHMRDVGTDSSFDSYVSNDFSILEGTLGVGMALRSYLNDGLFPWDGFLLTDCAPEFRP